MNKEDTLPKLLIKSYSKYGNSKVAMRKKIFGIWKEFTWEDYYLNVKYLCLGLMSLGLRKGDKLAIIGDNDPEWYWGEVACQAAGAAVVGIYTETAASELPYLINYSDATFVMAKDQEQVDKVLVISEELPAVEKVIYWDPRGLENYDDPILISFEQVQEMGRKHEESSPDLFERSVEQGSGQDILRIQFTSGTTGLAKGAIFEHGQIIKSATAWLQQTPQKETDDYLSYVPLAWATEEALGLIGQLLTGFTVNFPEKSDTVQNDTREISPHLLMYTSRGWEMICSSIQSRIEDAGRLKQFTYNLLFPVGYKIAEMKIEGKKPNLFWKLLYLIADIALFRQLRDKTGLARVYSAITGGSALAPDVLKFFSAMGVELRQGYAMTETGSLVQHMPDDIRYETLGTVFPGCEVRISDEYEILAKTPWMARGYYKKPGVFEANIDEDGFYQTGDAGYIEDNGHLIYWDRVDDLMELAGGQKYPPGYIEGRLKFSHYIKDCMAAGGGERPYVSLLVIIDYDNVAKWAEKKGVAFTTFADLSQKPEVYELILPEILRVNTTLPELARIGRYVLLSKEFDPDEAELTRTHKLRRAFVEDKYKTLIDAIYDGKEDFSLETVVRYRDGRERKVITPNKIASVKG